MTIFSMLFGAGIVLMTGRAEARLGQSAALHYRRMGSVQRLDGDFSCGLRVARSQGLL